MKIQPYVFPKNCEQAFRFYEEVLGGKIIELHRFKDMPPQEGHESAGEQGGGPSPEQLAAMGDKVMHVNLEVDGQSIMGSDGMEDGAMQGFKINLNFTEVEQGRKVFEALSKGGKVEMPFQETFWSKGFAMFEDRFGVSWMINVDDGSKRP